MFDHVSDMSASPMARASMDIPTRRMVITNEEDMPAGLVEACESFCLEIFYFIERVSVLIRNLSVSIMLICVYIIFFCTYTWVGDFQWFLVL